MRGVATGLEAKRNAISISLGRALARASTRFLLRPQRHEHVALPKPLASGDHVFDVVADLTEYTGLAPQAVHELVQRRTDSYRAEWHRLPDALRADDWYYLTSSMYLFANAIHFASPDSVEPLLSLVTSPSRILDFGGGTGNLALAFAALEHRVDYVEKSAIQRDFVALRIRRHGLGDRVRVLAPWEPLPRRAYDLVLALDVFEHVVDLKTLLERAVLPSLAPAGRLVERSPFGPDYANPMEHEDVGGLEGILRDNGLSPADGPAEAFRVWRWSDGARAGSIEVDDRTP